MHCSVQQYQFAALNLYLKSMMGFSSPPSGLSSLVRNLPHATMHPTSYPHLTSYSRPLRCAGLKVLCGHALTVPAPHKASPPAQLPCLHQAKSEDDWLFEPRMNCCCASLITILKPHSFLFLLICFSILQSFLPASFSQFG